MPWIFQKLASVLPKLCLTKDPKLYFELKRKFCSFHAADNHNRQTGQRKINIRKDMTSGNSSDRSTTSEINSALKNCKMIFFGMA